MSLHPDKHVLMHKVTIDDGGPVWTNKICSYYVPIDEQVGQVALGILVS